MLQSAEAMLKCTQRPAGLGSVQDGKRHCVEAFPEGRRFQVFSEGIRNQYGNVAENTTSPGPQDEIPVSLMITG